MAKEKTAEIKQTLIEFNFPVEGVTILAENLEKAQEALKNLKSKS